MNNILKNSLLFLLLLNIPLSANDWAIGRIFFWISLLVCFYFLLKRYGILSIILFALMVFFKAIESVFPIASFLYDLILAIIFSLTGLICFGASPDKLRKFLIIYLSISIPILFLQIIGVYQLQLWNTDYAHDLTVLSNAEVGTFKYIPQYPTFLVSTYELYYQIGQGRPPGLMSANNLLSVLVCFTSVLNLHIRNNGELNIGDIVVNLAAVMIMSKLTFVVILFSYSYGFMNKYKFIRRASMNNFLIFLFFILIYRLVFPGLFFVNLSFHSLTASLGTRIIDIMQVVGFENLLSAFWFAGSGYGLRLAENRATSGFAVLLSSNYLLPIVLLALFILWKLKQSISKLHLNMYHQDQFYKNLLVVIFLCFSVIPTLFSSILFTFLMGIILQVLYIKDKSI